MLVPFTCLLQASQPISKKAWSGTQVQVNSGIYDTPPPHSPSSVSLHTPLSAGLGVSFLCRNVWLHVCVCTTNMPGVGSQKRVSWTWSLYGCSSAAMLVLSIELGSSDTSLQPDSKEGSYYAALAGLESLCRSGYICV